MDTVYQIAVDGPSAAGKSSIARRVADALEIDYIDTGAMYRAVAYKLQQSKIDADDPAALDALLGETDIDFFRGRTFLDGRDVSDEIRDQAVARDASRISAYPAVREKLVALQRSMGAARPVIMDGRDIGTNVFPEATYKFFLTATVEERARRRWLELTARGETADLAQVAADIAARDENDRSRPLNPLRKAEDALELDTTHLSMDEVVEGILAVVRGTSGG